MNSKDFQVGFGTWQLKEHTYQATYAALEAGFRFIDAARIYGNEVEVGKAINDWLKNTNHQREDVFVQTKLWDDDFRFPEVALKTSLEKLNLEYVDSYLLHHVHLNFYENIHAWQELINLQKRGLTKQIGVSNHNREHIEALVKKTNVKPWTNQIELNPENIRYDRLYYLPKANISMQAYSPLGRGLFAHPVLVKLAKKHQISTSVLMIAFALAWKTVPIIRSTQPTHIKENLQALKVKLSQADIDEVSALNCYKSVCPETFNF